MVLDQSQLLMEASIVNPNKERLLIEIRHKVGLTLILTFIQIREYIALDKPALKQTFQRPIIGEKFQNNFLNLILNCSCIFLKQYSSQAGYIITKLTNQTLGKSCVTVLPIINLPATALHSLFGKKLQHFSNDGFQSYYDLS